MHKLQNKIGDKHVNSKRYKQYQFIFLLIRTVIYGITPELGKNNIIHIVGLHDRSILEA